MCDYGRDSPEVTELCRSTGCLSPEPKVVVKKELCQSLNNLLYIKKKLEYFILTAS